MLALAIVLAVACGFDTASAWAGEPAAAAAAVENLRFDLLELDTRYRKAKGARRTKLSREMAEVAKARAKILAELVRTDPAAAIAAATLADVRDTLPRAARRHVEENVELEGVLEVLVEDRHDGSKVRRSLRTADGAVRALHFAGDAPELESDTRLRVRGLRLKDVLLALDSDGGSVQVMAATLPRTLGAQRTLVILVNFRDKVVQPYTLAHAHSVVFGSTSAFFLENSFQQTWLEGDVVGWFTIPQDSTVCNHGSIASYAKSAATAAGVDITRYSRFVYAFPGNTCSWWGLGSVGGSPSNAWINGTMAMKVAAHELGHNLGLYHANAHECGESSVGTSCSTIEYGDPIDMMGQSGAGHFTAFAKERLGWLNAGVSPPIATVTSNGTYALSAYEATGSSPLALKILKASDPTTGAKTWYYLEYRRPIGFDAFLSSNANVANGITFHTGSEASSNSSLLLDMTPATTSWSDPALAVGKSFYDATRGVTVVPTAVGTGGASLSVSFGEAACVRVAPTVALSPSPGPWTQPGAGASFALSVTNNDTGPCAAAIFSLTVGVPAEWTGELAATSVSLAPGATGQVTLGVTSSPTAASGSYPISAAAVSSVPGAVTGSASATFRVLTDLAASVATDSASYRTNQTVTLSANVVAGDVPVSGASVVFRVTRPDGRITLLSATTGSTGIATSTLRLQKKDPAGAYAVLGTATVSASLSTTATTGFTVR